MQFHAFHECMGQCRTPHKAIEGLPNFIEIHLQVPLIEKNFN